MAPFWGAPAREAPGSVPVTPPPRRRAPGNPRGPRAPFCRARGRAQGVGESKLDERRAGRGGPNFTRRVCAGRTPQRGGRGRRGKVRGELAGVPGEVGPADALGAGVPPVLRRAGGQPWVRAARAAQNSLSPHSRFSIELRRLARNAQSFKPLEGSEPLNVCAVELRAALETSRRSPRSRLPFGRACSGCLRARLAGERCQWAGSPAFAPERGA